VKQVFVLAPERIRPKMAGMGIRAYELARALSGSLRVRLAIPNDPTEAPGARNIEIVQVRAQQLGEAAAGCDAALVSGHAASYFFHQVPEMPVVVDLYDPYFIENLHYAETLGPEVDRHDRAALRLALARGDHFLCAGPEQRFFYAGELHAVGRIEAASFADDPTLARLISVVPFGVPEEAPRGNGGLVRARIGAAENDPIVLFGGIYDWYDPAPLLDLWPELAARFPGIRLIFSENPNPESTPQKEYRVARERARAMGPSGGHIIFLPWQDYADRADLYDAATLLAVVCREGLETELSFRTRLLDAAWAGLPSISVGGGALARELERAGAAMDVPGGSPGPLLEAISCWLSDSNRRAEASQAARRFARERVWSRVVSPLEAFLETAAVSTSRVELSVDAEGGSSIGRAARRARALFR
jgi:glycosyltransferase involved in cell wall biosynthesis